MSSLTKLSHVESLPSSVNLQMCSFIDSVRSLCRYSACSKRTNALKMDVLFKRFFDKDFMDLPPLSEADIKEGIPWKEHYAKHVKIQRNIESTSYKRILMATQKYTSDDMHYFRGIQFTSHGFISFGTDSLRKGFIQIFKKIIFFPREQDIFTHSLVKELRGLNRDYKDGDKIPIIPVEGDELLAVVDINRTIQTYSVTTGALRDTLRGEESLTDCIGLRNTLVGREGCNIVAYRIANKFKEKLLKSNDLIQCFDIRFENNSEHRFEIVRKHRNSGKLMIGTCVVDTLTGVTENRGKPFDFPVENSSLCELQFVAHSTKVCSVFENRLQDRFICIHDVLSGDMLKQLPFALNKIFDQLGTSYTPIRVTANNFRIFSENDSFNTTDRYSRLDELFYDKVKGILSAIEIGRNQVIDDRNYDVIWFYEYDFSQAKTS